MTLVKYYKLYYQKCTSKIRMFLLRAYHKQLTQTKYQFVLKDLFKHLLFINKNTASAFYPLHDSINS